MKRKLLLGAVALTAAAAVLAEDPPPSAWRFAMVADTHVAPGETAIPAELVAAMLGESVELVLVAGDVVDAGRGASPAELRTQLDLFQTLTAPLAAAGIPVLPVRGNHEDDAPGNRAAWDEAFAGLVPANGPDGEVGLTYSFVHRNAFFVGLDQYVEIHAVPQSWLEDQLAANRLPHVFVFGHEPAFKVFHADNLDEDAAGRDAFWDSLARAGARVYLCGHDHFFDFARIDDGDGDSASDLHQAVVGTGGGRLFDRYRRDGDNSGFTPVGLFHEAGHGYLLVEISGDGSADLGVTLTWKRRTVDAATGAARYLPAYTFAYTAAAR
ncbi:MAG: metallophosphoesterase [Vicinamibacteria bacterium]|nr:metallophosphoesterase [Vicinamibacteria bacterium]